MITYLVLTMLIVGEPATLVRFAIPTGPAACGVVAARYLADPPKFPGRVIVRWSVSCIVQMVGEPT